MKKTIILLGLLAVVVLLSFYHNFNPYIEVGDLSDRLTNDPTLLRNMLKKDEVLARGLFELTDNTPTSLELKEVRDEQTRSEIYCSYNIDKHVDWISKQTGVYDYKGDTDPVSFEEFKNYLAFNGAYCVRALTLNPENTYYKENRLLIWSIETEGLKVYRKR